MAKPTRRPVRKPRRETLSDQLRAAIVATKRTDHAIAKDAGLDQSTVGRFMRAERTLTLDTAECLAEVLDLIFAHPTKTAEVRRPVRESRGSNSPHRSGDIAEQ